MKTNLLISGILLGAATVINAATNDLTTAIQRGLFEEEANQNLGAAIQAYQAVANQFDKDRKLAATAIFRLGECYRKQGNTNDAATQYERILRDFSDQPTLVTLSRQNLAGMGTAAPATAAPAMSDIARQEQKRLLEEEIKLVQKHSEEQQKQMQAGVVVSSDDRLATERDLLKLKRQVAAIDAGLPLSVAAPETTASAAPTDADEVRRIQALIKDSPDLVNAPVENGLTLLQSAAAKGKLAVVKQLLDSGAAVDCLQQPGPTPLHFAADNGHKAVVDLLLSKGAKVDAQTENGATPLHLAARQGYESVAKALLAAGAPVNAQTKGRGANSNFGMDPLQLNGFSSGQTPLHLAAKAGYAGMVQLLLAKGADVNAEDGDGRTPLSYAAQRPAILQLLLAAHANPNAGRLDLPLATAAYYGDLPALKVLLANGANPNTNSALSIQVSVPFGQIPTRGGKLTPLFLAVTQRHADAVKELLRNKADPNMPGGYSTRPVVGEALSDIPTLKAMLEGGADPNASNQGMPLLLQAVADKNQPAVELLLAHKADVNAAKSDGWTALCVAVSQGDKAIAELLLKAGAAVNIRNKEDLTPLWVAVINRNPELAALLLANKADPNATYNGWTPLHRAVAERQQEMVKLLLANKADPNARDNRGQTPLDLAKHPAGSNIPPPGMGTPMPMPARPLRGPSPGVPTTSQQESKPESMVNLLRQHGAVDDLPSLNVIMVRRSVVRGPPGVVLTKRTNDWNQFTLLDLIGMQYVLLTSSPGYEGGTAASDSSIFNRSAFPYPDLAHVHISRPTANLKSWQDQVVDLSPLFTSADCSANRPLAWGDVVVIPESDHPLNEQWPGFTRKELDNLKTCLTRKVEVVVKGVAKAITLAPRFYGASDAPSGATLMSSSGTTILPGTPFWLKPVLLQSKLVLVSSDLSRVKVTRRDAATGQERQWVVDCSEASPAPDFWLRDGDKIEVPEKTDPSAAAAAAGSQSSPSK